MRKTIYLPLDRSREDQLNSGYISPIKNFFIDVNSSYFGFSTGQKTSYNGNACVQQSINCLLPESIVPSKILWYECIFDPLEFQNFVTSEIFSVAQMGMNPSKLFKKKFLMNILSHSSQVVLVYSLQLLFESSSSKMLCSNSAA